MAQVVKHLANTSSWVQVPVLPNRKGKKEKKEMGLQYTFNNVIKMCKLSCYFHMLHIIIIVLIVLKKGNKNPFKLILYPHICYGEIW
jgi:hypothetical protein